MRSSNNQMMRPLDPEVRPFYLAEELVAPKVSITAGRVSVWVYGERPDVREIVIAGHAESRTCAAVSAAVFDAIKSVASSNAWMISAGTGHIRLPESTSDAEASAIEQMIDRIEGISNATGLVDVYYVPLDVLQNFRSRFNAQRGSHPPVVTFPELLPPEHVADYLPLIPDKDPTRRPFSFRINGWDFDCPEYQNLADRHLRALNRAFVRDALRLRQTYRRWLEEWMEDWIDMLHCLPQDQAEGVRLEVPEEDEAGKESTASQSCGAEEFLSQHAVRFVAKAAVWHLRLYREHTQKPYRPKPDSVLDAPRISKHIQLVDFPRALMRQRRLLKKDKPHTYRGAATESLPSLISTCLDYINRMNRIIRPYEELADRRRSGSKAEPLDEISRRILIDTMIRGWPSFYLDRQEDRAAFARWSDGCRQRVWQIMLQSAAKVGIAPELFLEDCVAYDVRFDADLGCLVTPKLLFEQTYYAAAHGTRIGASMVLPVWPRRCSRVLDNPGGAPNRDQALTLAQSACREVDRPGGASFRVASLLRSALNWHPVVAGRFILQEWLHRLGSRSDSEYRCAELLLEAGEMLARGVTPEARRRCLAYLELEAQPVPDAFVTLALCEVFEGGEAGRQYSAKIQEKRAVLDQMSVADEAGLAPSWLSVIALEELESDLYRLDDQRRTSPEVKRWIECALDNPDSVSDSHPYLSRAARDARIELRATLESGDEPVARPSTAMNRYSAYANVIPARALLAYALRLSRMIHDLDGAEIRETIIRDLVELSDAAWIASEVRSTIVRIRNEFFKGGIDTLLSESLKAGMQEAINACLSAADGLLDRVEDGVMPLEVAVMRLHIAITFDHAFAAAIDKLLQMKVPLARATAGSWSVLAPDIKEVPSGGTLSFDPVTGAVSVLMTESSTPLMKITGITDEERTYLRGLLTGCDLLQQAQEKMEPLAESLLSLHVVPRPSWQRWRDAIGQLRDDLIVTLSHFSASITLLDDCVPSLTDSGRQAVSLLDELPALDTPIINFDLRDDGSLSAMLGPGVLDAR